MTEQHENEFEKFGKGASTRDEASTLVWDIAKDGRNQDDVQKRYDNWCESYDQDMSLLQCNAPMQTARELLSYFYYNKDALILDCAAGTGLCGQELADHGMTNLHCLDLNPSMLKKAMSRGIFKKSIVAELGPNKTDIPENTYDGLVLCGAIFPGHITLECLPELIRIVKPGGFIVLGHIVRPTDSEEMALMNLHEARGLWKKMMWKRIPDFYDGDEGIICCHQVL